MDPNQQQQGGGPQEEYADKGSSHQRQALRDSLVPMMGTWPSAEADGIALIVWHARRVYQIIRC